MAIGQPQVVNIPKPIAITPKYHPNRLRGKTSMGIMGSSGNPKIPANITQKNLTTAICSG